MKLPPVARLLVDFTHLLRDHGFALAHEQVVMFLGAVRLLGPKDIESIRQAAHATLAPPPDRRFEFDVLFHAFFFEQVSVASAARSLSEEEAPVKESGRGQGEPPELRDPGRSGKVATPKEMLSVRQFGLSPDDEAMVRLRKKAPRALPRRLGFRKLSDRKGHSLDLRRSMRQVVAHDGDILRLMHARRCRIERPIVLLIDISGSMKVHTPDYLRYAHALTQLASKVETYTFGTRLTRITRPLRHRDIGRALEAASALVDDWDGGTRIGPALQAFMANPRYAALVRGAIVLVLSDGLERGDPHPMREAVARIARRAWYLAWLTPLAADPRFRPETAGLKGILDFLDRLDNGATLTSLVDHTLTIGAPS